MNGNLVIFMVTQERMGSPEAVVIYFASTTYHLLKSIASQWLSITAIFVSSLHGKERCVTRQNGCFGDLFRTRSADYRIVTKGAPHKEAKKALRDKTKSCCIKVHE